MQPYGQVQKVYVIVLTYKHYALTTDCVHSLMNLSYPQYRVVVVDNGSRDGTVEKLREEFGDQIDLIANAENLGVSAGNNVGIRHALEHGADYIMLLNNDTMVDPDFLQPLVAVLHSNGQVGAITPKIYFMNEPDRIWAAGGEVRWWLGQAKSRGRKQPDRGQFDKAGPVDYGTGCCLLLTRTALKQVGLLDERYFAYFEDTDWCVRARRAGFRIWYEPVAKIWHLAGASWHRGGTSPLAHYLLARHNLWFIQSYTQGVSRWVALLSFSIRRLLFFSLGFLVLRRWQKLKSLWRGARDGWRGPGYYPF